MRRMIFTIIALAFIFASCSTQQESPVNSPGEGKILFKISKENAPAAVNFVTMRLTRSGFTTITSQLNLTTDTTAELTMDGIPSGLWHLKVDATSSNNVLLYTGEADLNVIADQLTQINLTLNPVSSGLGSIKIMVNWGTTPVSAYPFKDYQANPILVPLDSGWDVNVSQPLVMYDGVKYRMYYSSMTYGARGAIGYAESPDGLTWTRPFDGPMIFPSSNGWDSQCITPGGVIKDGNVWYLYYMGFSDQYGTWHIGLATSTDGMSWTKRPQPVLMASGGAENQLVPTSVIKKNGVFYLYYTSRNYPVYTTCVATSIDGINWQKSSLNPILSATLPWEGTKVSTASVIMDGDSLIMVYSSLQGDKNYFGMATSVDGMTWVKKSTPVFSNLNTTNGWARTSIDYSRLVKAGNQLRVYYGGYNGNQWTRIGVTIWER